MRVLAPSLAVLVSLLAASAEAQVLQPSLGAELRSGGVLLDQQVIINRQAVQQHNDLMVLDAQLRTQRALSDVQAQNYRPILPAPRTGGAPQIDTGRLASIPDAKLEASNAAVRAAAENRR